MHKYLTFHVFKETYRQYWKEKDSFGKFLSLPTIALSLIAGITIAPLIDFIDEICFR